MNNGSARMKTRKKALVVASFGTSVAEALPAIINIEEACQTAFPDYDFYRAFTSQRIVSKLKQTKQITVDSVENVMEKLVEAGYEEVLCQPTFITSGAEYDKMVKLLLSYRNRIPNLRVGNPLLVEKMDYKKMGAIVWNELPEPLSVDEAFVFMGHGREDSANLVYRQLENVLRDTGEENVYVGTWQGTPGLDEIILQLRSHGIRKVYLMPLLTVAGKHARKDLAGSGEDSWVSRLQSEGFGTEVILKGLGEIDAVAALFAEHSKKTGDISTLEEHTGGTR